MPQQYAQIFCLHCGQHTLHIQDRYQVPHAFHLLMSLVTFGVWVWVWLFHVVANLLSPRREWICHQCGQVPWKPTPQQNAELERARVAQQNARQADRRDRRASFWQRVDGWLERRIGEGPAVAFFGGMLRGCFYGLPVAAIALATLAAALWIF